MEFQLILTVLCALIISANSLKQGECEVCIKVLDKFAGALSDSVKKDHKLIESEFKDFCKSTKNKENRFVSICVGLKH
jgi:hypothetical protein